MERYDRGKVVARFLNFISSDRYRDDCQEAVISTTTNTIYANPNTTSSSPSNSSKINIPRNLYVYSHLTHRFESYTLHAISMGIIACLVLFFSLTKAKNILVLTVVVDPHSFENSYLLYLFSFQRERS